MPFKASVFQPHPDSFIVVHWLSQASLFATPRIAACQASLTSGGRLHYLLEPAQTHVHWVGDAIQPSYPLLPSFPPAFNLSQQQGLFQRISSLHQGGQSTEASASASVLPMNIQGWFPFKLTGLTSLHSWTVALQAPLFMEFSRQEYWVGLSFPPPRDLTDPGTEPEPSVIPALQADSLPSEPSGKAHIITRELFWKYTCNHYWKSLSFGYILRASLIVQNLPAMQKIPVRFLDQEDLLEKE